MGARGFLVGRPAILRLWAGAPRWKLRLVIDRAAQRGIPEAERRWVWRQRSVTIRCASHLNGSDSSNSSIENREGRFCHSVLSQGPVRLFNAALRISAARVIVGRGAAQSMAKMKTSVVGDGLSAVAVTSSSRRPETAHLAAPSLGSSRSTRTQRSTPHGRARWPSLDAVGANCRAQGKTAGSRRAIS